MPYYLHIEAQDYEIESYDYQGDLYRYTTVFWRGPFESKGEALEMVTSKGYQDTNTKITVIDFGD